MVGGQGTEGALGEPLAASLNGVKQSKSSAETRKVGSKIAELSSRNVMRSWRVGVEWCSPLNPPFATVPNLDQPGAAPPHHACRVLDAGPASKSGYE